MRTITRVLCPMDFSEASDHALDHAIVLAGWFDASLVALHAYNPILLPVTGLATVEPGAALPDDAELARLGDEMRGRLRRALVEGIDTDVVVQIGPPTALIVEIAEKERADLIVMGTHGASGFERFVLGSVTEKVLRKAVCPVLTVPPRAEATSTLPFKRLLCPVDFSEPSLAALRFALSLAQESEARLTILHVVEWPVDDEPLVTPPFDVPEYRRAREADVRDRLERLVPEEARDWCQPSLRIGHGKPYRAILGVAAEDAADLVVMGVHGRNPLDLVLFGSTTNHIVRQATCPVLTLRR